MAHRRIPLAALRVGMHVTKIDRRWFWSPLLFHSFPVRTTEQIEHLQRHGIKEVEIDPSRGLDVVENHGAEAESRLRTPDNRSIADASRHHHIPSLHSLSQDLVLAHQARQRLEQAVHSIFSDIAATGVVEPEEARKIILDMKTVTQSIALPALFMALNQDRGDDPLLSQHAMAVCGLSMVLAHAAGFDLLALQTVATGALLHDIGLLQLPAYLRRRCHETSAPLSRQEQLLYQSHARLSAVILERQGQFSPSLCQLAADHHALLDNTGFPQETRGAFTSDMTRIVMVTDRYDELLRGFGGAAPLTPHQALQRLYQEGQAGTYERRYIACFVKVLGIYPVYSAVRLNTGERAIVTVTNSGKLHQPIVTITHGADGAACSVPLVIDLADQEERAPARSIAALMEGNPTVLDQPAMPT
jgi:HD-GYP domain-containing protein (c-di-GMP phosphodiesterase class II)